MPAPSHRMTGTPTYRTWASMIQRCYNPNIDCYKKYGARGITVCGRWRDSFIEFIKDMGERPNGTSIERNNNAGNYEPGNCRWATPLEQGRNKRNNRIIAANGFVGCISEWEEKQGMEAGIVGNRLKRGWTPERAISAPVRHGRSPEITINGVMRSVVEWAQISGLKSVTLKARLRAGWMPERAISEPLHPR
jgi:hypothetical protein